MTDQPAQQQEQPQQQQGVVGAAVAQREATASTIVKNRPQFGRVLPKHIDAEMFTQLAVAAFRKDPKLAEAADKNPDSAIRALMECAELGHRPGSDQYALVPFRMKKERPEDPGVEVVGIEQYQGEVERMYRAGAVRAVKCELVRQYDDYFPSQSPVDPPVHNYNPFADEATRGELIGVYAYAIMQDGAISQVVQMGRTEVMKHREVAKTKEIWDGPFRGSMWKKTAIHELEKWVPTSSEYLRERLRLGREVAAEVQQVDTRTGEIISVERADR